MKVSFDKNIYDAEETAVVKFEINNSLCNFNVQNINIGVRHIFVIGMDGYSGIHAKNLKKAWIPGP